MKLNITYNGQTISVADGKSLTLKCKDLKARSNIIIEAVADVVEMQTLIVVNTNNTAETATFTMPSGYTFGEFIGSEYNTDESFSTTNSERVKYNNISLVTEGGPYVLVTEIASGTFYYIGESATTQTLTVWNLENDKTARFTMPIGYTLAEFIGSEYDTSDGKFTIDADTNYVFYDGYALWVNAGLFDKVSANAIAGHTFVYVGA